MHISVDSVEYDGSTVYVLPFKILSCTVQIIVTVQFSKLCKAVKCSKIKKIKANDSTYFNTPLVWCRVYNNVCDAC